ncbi:hypothetical protein [Paenibacillus alkalitolerans]|uniref:hypothetical protein n=1 Tax=Paenibacillus alkalitolerans TaxID=2799335 RepID=UPI0018F3D864|nr:hypothetical protein [Paenibacillus alkalitolerans]
MTRAKNGVDKNLQNVVDELERPNITAHTNMQLQQDQDDRRHRDKLSVGSQRHEAEQYHESEK